MSRSAFAIRPDDALPRWRVWMCSRPAMCRTFYDGKVDVFARDEDEAVEAAKARAFSVHGHGDWDVKKIEAI